LEPDAVNNEERIILQLNGAVEPQRLERAYELSRQRYLRLTARGPLRFYRAELLGEAEKAYQALKRGISRQKDDTGAAAKALAKVGRPMSLLARQVAGQRHLLEAKGPVKSSIKGGWLVERQGNGPGAEKGQQVVSPQEKRQRAMVEDEFCREVIYRLEGELIRYNSRRELLEMARQRGIGQFRANMLIAQIVEAVRQHQLYKESQEERKLAQKQRAEEKGYNKILIAIVVAIVAIITDVVLLRYLEG